MSRSRHAHGELQFSLAHFLVLLCECMFLVRLEAHRASTHFVQVLPHRPGALLAPPLEVHPLASLFTRLLAVERSTALAHLALLPRAQMGTVEGAPFNLTTSFFVGLKHQRIEVGTRRVAQAV